MLDFAHALTLKAVARGDSSHSPALENLEACGLVEHNVDAGTYRLTEAGRRALEAGRPSRLERIGYRMILASAVVFGVGWLIDRLT